MLLLIADDDPSFRAFVLQTLEGSEFEAHDVSDDPAMLASNDAIVVLGGRFVTGHLVPRNGSTVLVALTDGDTDALELALVAGADDGFFKPIAPRAFLARLVVARHQLARARCASTSAWNSVEAALRASGTGLVAIRGEHSGAIHVHEGCISWAESARHNVSLAGLLARFDIPIDPEAASAVLGEARASGKHFTQILVEWGLVSADLVRECVRSYLAEIVRDLLSDPRATALFMPYDPRRASSLSYAPHEVMLEPRPLPNSGVVPNGTRTVQHTLPTHALMALQGVSQLAGCRGATLMDRAGGRLAFTGEPLDSHFAWAVVHAMQGPQPSLTIEQDGVAHIARPLDSQRVLIASFTLHDVNLGLARNSMTQTCHRALEGTLVLARAAGIE